MNLNQLAKNILKTNIYLSLSTCAQNTPWIAPVFYHTDPQNNLYFASQLTSVHARHICKNPKIAFAIFDSRQRENEGVGIQAAGRVEILEAPQKYYPIKFTKVSGKAKYRIFKITPTVFYLNDPRVKTDRRVIVNL